MYEPFIGILLVEESRIVSTLNHIVIFLCSTKDRLFFMFLCLFVADYVQQDSFCWGLCCLKGCVMGVIAMAYVFIVLPTGEIGLVNVL